MPNHPACAHAKGSAESGHLQHMLCPMIINAACTAIEIHGWDPCTDLQQHVCNVCAQAHMGSRLTTVPNTLLSALPAQLQQHAPADQLR
jgi:hypothetical protein